MFDSFALAPAQPTPPPRTTTESVALVSPPAASDLTSGLGQVAYVIPGLLMVAALLWAYGIFFPNCRPNQILVISGRRHRRQDGQMVGYRVITGGRSFALPIFESRQWMDVRSNPVFINVDKAYAKGGTPIDVQAIATIKVDTDQSHVGNAIERFLSHGSEELLKVSRKTLEGHLRTTIANLTPEEVNQDRLRFAHEVSLTVAQEMGKLGLRLDTFKILRVSDEVDYFNSLGRGVLAEVLRDAAIAEAEGFGTADRREAEAQERAEVAATQALRLIQQKQNELRTIRAELEQKARSAEDRVEAVAAEARARAEQTLQALRADLERRRLEAEEVLPAQARQQAEQLQARGKAAALAENTRAQAIVNDQLTSVWREAGEDAAAIFLLQQVEMVLAEAAKLPAQLKLGQIAVLDSGDGQSLAQLVNVYPAIVRQFLDSVRDTLGIEVLGALRPAPSGANLSSPPLHPIAANMP